MILRPVLLTVAGLAFIGFAFVATEEAYGILISAIMAIGLIYALASDAKEKAFWAARARDKIKAEDLNDAGRDTKTTGNI
jgi:hypothetical protein